MSTATTTPAAGPSRRGTRPATRSSTEAFAYDRTGNRTSVADSKGGTQTSTFDLANRLTIRKLDGSAGDVRVDYTYTDRDEIATVTRFSDLTGTTQEGKSSYAYDDGGRLTDIEHRTGSGAGTLIADYAYEYDLANRLTEKTENTVTKTYSYDAIGQITGNNGSSVTYDDTGNRTLSGYVTADGNRMTSDGVWTYAHDLDGNVVGKSKSGTAWTYEYDLRGQLVEASDGTTTVTYAYDAFGNRIGRTEDDGVAVVEEQYVQDGWDPAKAGALGTENFDAILDLEGDGDVIARHVFGPGYDEVVARQDAVGDVDWYVADRLGSVRAVFDNSGTVTNAIGYDGFGGFLGGVPVDRYGFAGREWDEALGLQYNRARMYDPSTGRWLGEDGIRQRAGDPNLYRYVGNGATNGTDPSGFERRMHGPINDTEANPPSGHTQQSNPNSELSLIEKIGIGLGIIVDLQIKNAQNAGRAVVDTAKGIANDAKLIFEFAWSDFGGFFNAVVEGSAYSVENAKSAYAFTPRFRP